MSESAQELVRRDLVVREALERQHCGTNSCTFNSRNALIDAYQEALDLAVYLRQVLAEQGITEDDIVDQPLPVAAVTPEHRAAREHAEDECGSYCTHGTVVPDAQGDFYQDRR